MPSRSHIEIGAARQEDLETVLTLLCDAFRLPYAEAREIFYADPWFHLENKRVLRVDGRVVSCLTLVDLTCWVGQGTVRVAGIAGVVTEPAERGKGYASLLLVNTLPHLRERGFDLTLLFPSEDSFYRRLGWETSSTVYRYLTAPTNLPLYTERTRLRSIREEDIPALETIYAEITSGRTLHALRDRKRWGHILQNVKQRMVALSEQGTVEGYLLFEHRGAREEGENGLPVPSTLRILEMRTVSEAAKRTLVGYLAEQQNMGCIEYEATYDDLVESGLLQLLREGRDAHASVDVLPGGMVRVVNLTATLNALSVNWKPLEAHLGILLHDDVLGQVSASIVHCNEGQWICREADPEEAASLPDVVRGGVRAWSTVLPGHRSGAEACSLLQLQTSSRHALALVTLLFPRSTPFLALPDHP